MALDAPPQGWVLANPENAKAVMAALLDGEEVRLQGNQLEQAGWLTGSDLPIDDDGDVVLTATDIAHEACKLELVYHPQTHVIGVGCERETSSQEVQELVTQAVENSGIASGSVAGVVSIDLKADETAIHSVGEMLGVPARFFDAATLENEASRLANPSDIVFAETGCHGVCEGAALAAAGNRRRIDPAEAQVQTGNGGNCACVRADRHDECGQKRGRLFVVGIGPGRRHGVRPK